MHFLCAVIFCAKLVIIRKLRITKAGEKEGVAVHYYSILYLMLTIHKSCCTEPQKYNRLSGHLFCINVYAFAIKLRR